MTVRCEYCNQVATKRCRGCKVAFYCSKLHQKADWPKHREVCKVKLAIRQDVRKGRYAVASKYIEAGATVLAENAAVVGSRTIDPDPMCLGCCVILSLQSLRHRCSKCGIPLCSRSCENSHHHKMECRYFKKTRTFKQGNEDLEVDFEIVTPLRCLLMKQANTESFQKLMQLTSNLEAKQREPQDWERISSMADKLQHNCPSILCLFTSQSNSHLQWDLPSRHTHDALCGLYIDCAATFNHDCSPNCRAIISSTYQMEIVACRDISEGSELTLSYVQPFMTTPQRRRHLKRGKLFECSCRRCSDPTEFGTFFSAIRCKSCYDGHVISTNPLDDSAPWKCVECQYFLDAETALVIDRRLESELDRISKHTVTSFTSRLNPDRLFRVLESYEGCLHPSHAFIAQVKMWICEGQERSAESSLRYLDQLLDIFGRLEPQYSYINGLVSLLRCRESVRTLGHPADLRLLRVCQKAFEKEDFDGPERVVLMHLRSLTDGCQT